MQKSDSIWQQCNGLQQVTSTNVAAWRTVEAQHLSSTRKLVSSMEEHALLEEMLESSKPQQNHEEFHNLHYLLSTPFRYPPLLHGSRFGTQAERAIWYGSLQRQTTFAETAYYRLAFLQASAGNLGPTEILLTCFKTKIKSARVINLTQPPFKRFAEKISAPNTYLYSQSLGHAMREAGIEVTLYFSARDPLQGTNLGVFTPKAFAQKQPESLSFQTWVCRADENQVELTRTAALHVEKYEFKREVFANLAREKQTQG